MFQHPVILAISRPMHELKLEPVGIGEEQRVVARALGWAPRRTSS
jgi:hypothetical protein